MLNDNIHQTITHWCFSETGPKWDLETFCQVSKNLGLRAVEGVHPDSFSILKKHNLDCALTTSHLFVRGMNNKAHWDECISLLTKAITASGEAGYKNTVTFTGFLDTSNEKNGSIVSPEEGVKNCVEGYKKIVPMAEKAGVTINLETLNTRDEHPLKGHPGYQGNHIDICVDIIQQVGSPNLKLLYDAYHIQVMDGDITRRVFELADIIGHVQIAGNPGRGEIDATQEINYVPMLKALVKTGYQ